MAQTIPFPPELLALDNRDSPIKLTNFSEIAGKVGFTLPLTYIMVEQAQALNTVVKAVPGVNEATRQAIGAFALKVNSTFASPVQPGNQQIQQILDEIRVLSAEVRAMRGETRSSELRAANSVRASIRAPLTPLPAVNGRHLPQDFEALRPVFLADIRNLPLVTINRVLHAYNIDVPADRGLEDRAMAIWRYLGGGTQGPP